MTESTSKKECVICLKRPGVKSCGPFMREVEYTVPDDIDAAEAHRLVEVKGFEVVRGTLPAIKKEG